jgi:S1-C subfamily serine protease
MLIGHSAQAVTYDSKLNPDKLAELAQRDEFKSVCQVNGASGVLIAPNAILTARHVVRGRGKKTWAKNGGRALKIDRIVEHESVDIAILILAEPIKDIPATPIYRGEAEVGMTVWKVGYGLWAPLVQGHRKMLKRGVVPRAITNNIYEANQNDVYYKYDPDGAGHTEFEGGTAPGDSGGPLYAEVDGKWFVVGVTSGPRNGFYADARLSTKAAWIDDSIRGDASDPTPKVAK